MGRNSYNELVKAVEPFNTDEQNNSADPLADWDGVYCFRQKATCVCGQPKCMNLSQIQNKKTQRILFPIGSTCIKRFLPKSYDAVLRDMTTCKCGNKKSQHYIKCDECYSNDGIRRRGQFVAHKDMDFNFKHWTLEKHPYYSKGTELRRWLTYYIKKTSSV